MSRLDYREEAKLWIAMEAGLATLAGVAKVLGVSHPEAEGIYQMWLKAPTCPSCGDRCLNFVCPECGGHNDMPFAHEGCA